MNYDWFQVQGGDGFVAILDPRDPRIVYTESQDGNITRKNKVTGESKSIRPTDAERRASDDAGRAFRFNWDTPMVFSPHEPGTLLVAANRVFRSTDRGDSWTVISPRSHDERRSQRDVVTMGLRGNRDPHRRERRHHVSGRRSSRSPNRRSRPGVYYTGTDDGTVSVSRDGGKTWQNITKNLPGFPAGALDLRSRAVEVRCRHGVRDRRRPPPERLRDRTSGSSNDFGATFRSLNGNLKGEVVKTLTEDHEERRRALPRHRDRHLPHARPRQELAPAEGEPADGARRRDHAAPARQRDDRRHARPRDLDPRSPRADPGIRGGAGAADAKLFSPGPALQWKHEGRPERRVLGSPVLRRREPADRGGDSVPPEEHRHGCEAEGHRRDGQRGA